MPYADIAELIASLRYNSAKAARHSHDEAHARIASERKFHREESYVASNRCTEIIRELNANMATGIDPDDWQNRTAQIEAFLGASAEGVAA